MTRRAGPIYEVTLFIDHDVVGECDRWLEEHVRESLRLAAVVDCHVFTIADDAHGRAGRICQHVLETDEALDGYVDGPAMDIETEIAARFGGTVAIRGRILREDRSIDLGPDTATDCLNCGTHLRGQYCGNCGQRSRSRLISLWELITDAFGDLFELDSRLWQTLLPMVTRPGRLTHDYLQGRRARYMPPFRMYLVMSLIFFVVAFFDPREEFGLLFEPVSESGETADPETKAGRGSVVIDLDGDSEPDDDCEMDAADLEDIPAYLQRRLTPERLRHICEQILADDGKSLLEKVLGNIPTALIVLLPLMALVQKALYPLSRRYYVEHLLFFVHFHAFFFLILTLQILFTRLAAMVALPDVIIALTAIAVSIYIAVYLFVAMRRVYGQGRIATFLKYIMLLVAYITGISLIMGVTFAIAAFSI